ncbi:MAG: flavodoxin domain-containing protein [Thermodesulfobacteriota bacterium]|nr:flavodoxin domain-containing protein [Thermodesulfobacteriota bacterium]
MKKVLIVYDSRTGNTEKMAEYIAEGVRLEGVQAELKKLSEVKHEKEIKGYEGYVFGSPTYHRDMTNGMKTFLFIAQKAELKGKVGGAFGSYTHSGDAPKVILDTMEFVFKMDIINLGSFNLKEDLIQKEEGLRASQEYGKAIAQKLHN